MRRLTLIFALALGGLGGAAFLQAIAPPRDLPVPAAAPGIPQPEQMAPAPRSDPPGEPRAEGSGVPRDGVIAPPLGMAPMPFPQVPAPNPETMTIIPPSTVQPR